jgi:hypothetical protein
MKPKVKEPQAVRKWKKAVELAKKKLHSQEKFVMVRGKLLSEAMKIYCAMGY